MTEIVQSIDLVNKRLWRTPRTAGLLGVCRYCNIWPY